MNTKEHKNGGAMEMLCVLIIEVVIELFISQDSSKCIIEGLER